jgi:hypothetical protein
MFDYFNLVTSSRFVNVLPVLNAVASDNNCSKVSLLVFWLVLHCLVQNNIHEWVVAFKHSRYSSITVKMKVYLEIHELTEISTLALFSCHYFIN